MGKGPVFSSSAPGRVSILGNPSDIYGGKVIAMTIQYRAEVSINHSNDFSVKAWGGREVDENLLRLIGASINRLVRESWMEDRPRMEVWVKTDIPRESGMGGSTAIIVAFLDACRKMFGLTYDNYRMSEIAQKVEHKDLGITAGYNDRYSISFGGLLFMDFTGKDVDREVWEGEPYAKINRLQAEEIPLVCGYWGLRRSSGNVHAKIRERYLKGDGEVSEAVRRLTELTEEGKGAIVRSDWKALAELMNENYEIVRKIGWAYPVDDKLRETGLQNGAVAAKLGGAGNGGVMIFLTLEGREKPMKALMNAGAKAFIPRISEGVH